MKKDGSKKEKPKYDSTVTKEDLDALGKKGLSPDGGDDRLLQEREEDIDFSGKALDIPGRARTNKSKSPKLRDEENTLYGQGGDNKENLEEPERSNTTSDQKEGSP